MLNLTGKPEVMKKMNMTIIYKALMEMGSATRAEIADKTQISTTTVRTLLEELMKNGEIIELQLDESSGGRRAQRYTLNPERNLILSLYFKDKSIVYQINDLTGNIVKADSAHIDDRNVSLSAIGFISKSLEKWEICAIGLGVPGIVEKGRYYVSTGFNQWIINNIGERIQNTYHMPVILENDLNAIAVGFAVHYAKNNDCDINNLNMAYIHFNKSCTGAGIIANGKVVHGAKRFAGELGFLPLEPNKTLDAVLQAATSQEECADAICRAISIVNCVTNPSLIVIGGDTFGSGRISPESLKMRAQTFIPGFILPEVIFSNNWKHDYLAGLAYLTIQAVLPKLPLSAAV